MSKFLLALTLVASLGYGQNGVAQQPAPSLPVYDTVVIKQSDSLVRGNHTDVDDTTFQATNVSLKHLLVNAYGIREGLMFGLPGWASSSRFDITAKVTDPDLKTLRSLTREQRQAMLAAVLVDRFHLKTHTEIKTLPVYEMIVAKGGPKLKVSAVPSDPANPDRPGLGNMNVHNTTIIATGVTLSELAGNLAFPLDRTVIDKTGLTGRYDFQLQWTPDNAANGAADSGAADLPPDLFTAMQEQLGLRLQAAKGPVETLVVDHVEQPTQN
ncbi:TIGR03435 family protein [Granulicella sp. 5B5]|uniref:TIGR03435 family protein n=1 Tax=Granulicella sp. 5B5 TaxID=1617967 RepID=UPI0015F4CAF3|nr:TIGR03435 family protein [Granulicella sp. 5B5]QMV18483.1 TIGR03435 family protein [Granulicella sp. 5B5]